MKVRAKRLGFYNHSRIREGTVFHLRPKKGKFWDKEKNQFVERIQPPEEQFSELWMEKWDAKAQKEAAKAAEKAEEAADQEADESVI